MDEDLTAWKQHRNGHCPAALSIQCLRKLSTDDDIKINLHNIPNLPKFLIQKLAKSSSAYGLCLLESQGLLEGDTGALLWKILYDRIASKLYEPLSQQKSNCSSLKRIYFQKAFHDVLQFYNVEWESFAMEKLYQYLQRSKLFSEVRTKGAAVVLENLSSTFKAHLKSIRIYPRILSTIKGLLFDRNIFADATVNVTSLEFRDFMSFKKQHIVNISRVLRYNFVPDLEALSFINCKFNGQSIEKFDAILGKMCIDAKKAKKLLHTSKDEDVLDVSKDNNVDGHRKYRFWTDLSDYDDDADDLEVLQKKQKLDDSLVSLDDAFCSVEPSSSHIDNQVKECSPFYNPFSGVSEEVAFFSNILYLSFQNCSFTTDATKHLCHLLKKMPELKSFSLCPEWQYFSKHIDRVIPSVFCTSRPEFEKASSVSFIENITLENYELGFYSKKLLMWHPKGECTMQQGVQVPRPKVLKLIDCNLSTFRAGCSCKKIQNFSEGDPDNEKGYNGMFLHTRKCDEEYRWCLDFNRFCNCNWRSLTMLDLSENKLPFKGAQTIAKALKNAPLITAVKLADCYMDTQSCQCIFEMAKENSSLKHLDVSGNSYDARKDSSLSDLIENGELKTIILRSCIIAGGLTKTLQNSFAKNGILEELDLAANRIGSEQFLGLVKVLSEPSTLSALIDLDLSANRIPATVLPEFAKSLEASDRRMREVKFHGNPGFLQFQEECHDEDFFRILNKRVSSYGIEDKYGTSSNPDAFSDFVSVM